MALPPLAEVQDLADWVGEDLSDDTPRVEAWIRGASSLVRAAAKQTWTEVNGDDEVVLTAVPDEIHTVVLQCVERKWRNPAGITQDTAGPLTERFSERAAEGLFLTEAETAVCRRYAPTSGVWTQPVTRDPDDEDSTLTVPVEGDDDPFPWFVSGDLGHL